MITLYSINGFWYIRVTKLMLMVGASYALISVILLIAIHRALWQVKRGFEKWDDLGL